MEKVKVLTLKDVRHNGADIASGQTVDIERHLLNDWVEFGLAVPFDDTAKVTVKEPKEQDVDENLLEPLRGGYYKLPNGEKVRGKEKAIEALKALKGGKENESQNNNGTDSGSCDTSGDEGISES